MATILLYTNPKASQRKMVKILKAEFLPKFRIFYRKCADSHRSFDITIAGRIYEDFAFGKFTISPRFRNTILRLDGDIQATTENVQDDTGVITDSPFIKITLITIAVCNSKLNKLTITEISSRPGNFTRELCPNSEDRTKASEWFVCYINF